MKASSVYKVPYSATSVPAVSKSCSRSLAVSQMLLSNCLLRNLVAAVDSFLFLPCQCSVATDPLTLNSQTMLPTVSLETFTALLFPSFFVCERQQALV